MDTTDKISLFLGAVSVLLAIYAVYQSWNYRKLDKKIDNDREQMLNEIREKTVAMSVLTRAINEVLNYGAGRINISKDELRVWKGSAYRACNDSIIIEKMNDELPKILKQTYIDSLIAALNTADDNRPLICTVTLRHQYDAKDIEKIRNINQIFNEYGIYFEFVLR